MKMNQVHAEKTSAIRFGWKSVLSLLLALSLVLSVPVESSAASKVKLKLAKTSFTLKVGKTATIKAKVKPTKFKKKLKYKSSKSSVASVSSKGKIKAKKAGKAKITVSIKGKSVKKVVKVTVKKKTTTKATATPVPTATVVPTPAATPTPTAIAVTVATQNELTSQLAANPGTLTIQTQDAVQFDIPAGAYPNTDLIIDAPRSDVKNAATFKSVTIKAIAPNTYTDSAHGNNISVLAETSRVVIATGASASVQTNTAGNQNLNLVNNGTITNLTLNCNVQLNITGFGNGRQIPVTANQGSEGSTIDTVQSLELTAKAKVTLILEEGSEGTVAYLFDAAFAPIVQGLGSVELFRGDTTEVIDTITAISNYLSSRKVTINASASASGAAMYLLPYVDNFDLEQTNLNNAARDKQDVVEGKAQFTNVPLGNYILVAEAEGYIPAYQIVRITSLYSEFYEATPFEMIPIEEANGTGSVSGDIQDAQVQNALYEGPLVINVRKGLNNNSGAVVKQINASGGHYSIDSLPVGYYTIQTCSDPSSEIVIVSSYANVCIRKDQNVEAQLVVTKTVRNRNSETDVNGSGALQFTLTWLPDIEGLNVPSDLDSHLIGPGVDVNTSFHTFYRNKTYSANNVEYVELDRDDTDYEGPEHTTIYYEQSGTYKFYVHNYSDGGSTTSSRLSNNSQAVVKVTKGGTEIATYQVPTGFVGNLWYVCDYTYSAETGIGRLSGVNTISVFEGDTDEVGQPTITLGDIKSGNESLMYTGSGRYYTVYATEEQFSSLTPMFQEPGVTYQIQASDDSDYDVVIVANFEGTSKEIYLARRDVAYVLNGSASIPVTSSSKTTYYSYTPATTGRYSMTFANDGSSREVSYIDDGEILYKSAGSTSMSYLDYEDRNNVWDDDDEYAIKRTYYYDLTGGVTYLIPVYTESSSSTGTDTLQISAAPAE